MRVGLYTPEPRIHNTALMQISQYHKDRGDEVSWYYPGLPFDKVYASSLFAFTDKGYTPPGAVCGGTGYDVRSRLPPEIEAADLDYSLFPKCRTSYLWFSRGCIRRCPYCVVPEKEGEILAVEPKNLNPRGESITVQDNNFFASPEWREAIQHLHEYGQPVHMMGIDIKILDDEMAGALNGLRLHKQIKMAWDDPKEDLSGAFAAVARWLPPRKVMVYVLIGYWSMPEEDLHRVMTLRGLGYDPFVMPYNKHDEYQRRFARWVNHKAIFKSVKWEDYGRMEGRGL